MASTYTSNTGIEKIGSGEQSGTWGNTTNNNFDIIDRTLNGVVTLTITGNTSLTTVDGQLSDGHYKVIVLSGSPSGQFNLHITPNDQQKWFFIKNTTAQIANIRQGPADANASDGSGTEVLLGAGSSAIVFADGTGSNANVSAVPTDLVNDLTPQLGGDLDTNGQAILFGSSKWAISLDTGDNELLFKYNGTTVFKLGSNGAVTSADNITAFGTSL
jgi:hypothetical protein|tara:strand:- start:221 stop:868 length:648 start_codon:yes stop_codon:yes gene_type:complete